LNGNNLSAHLERGLAIGGSIKSEKGKTVRDGTIIRGIGS
jgi:hypothetical protein